MAAADPYHLRRAPTTHHYSSNSREELGSEIGSVEFATYTVQIPPTPDNQPMEIPAENGNKMERSLTSNSMFTGGHNCATHAHLKEKMIESQTSHPRVAGENGSFCSVPGCDAQVITDKRGVDLVPCECEYKICWDCYKDVLATGDGICPGCKEPYRSHDVPELHSSRLSFGKSKATSQSGNDEGTSGVPKSFVEKQWKPLSCELKISNKVIVPYRLLIPVRMIVLALFLHWRVSNPNEDARWLWSMSTVCEIWFAFSWLLDQLPKLCPINRVTDLDVLKEKFETPSPSNPTGKSDLPGIDIFVSTADPEKEPPLVTANTVLSVLAADYPVEKLSYYVSDDGGALLTFEAMAEAASFASLWVPFCRKHEIEPRNPESYFNLRRDPYKNKIRPEFVRDRRRVKREYEEFKVRINGLSDSNRRRSDAYNTQEELKAMKRWKEKVDDEPMERLKIPKATWMADGTHWPGTWTVPAPEHTRGDHASILQVMLQPPSDEPLKGIAGDSNSMNLSEVDIRLPVLAYVSREKRPGYDHNKKARAMNALVRASAVMSNGPFILNLDCDHYIYNSQALREGICFMMDRGGEGICYVQFPQRFEGIDPSDRYANHNTVFFDVNMRALDGIQGPVYVGTGCLFRRTAFYDFDPPSYEDHGSCFFGHQKKAVVASAPETSQSHGMEVTENQEINAPLNPRKFGNSSLFLDSVRVAAFQGLPLTDNSYVKYGRPPGVLTGPRPLHLAKIAEAVNVISCWMHGRGWRSIYCVTERDAFRGTAPINLTDRLHQVLRWATGSVEIFFSRNNTLLGGPRLKLLQRIAYLNVGIYPFTSILLVVYCFIPAFSLFTNLFIVASLTVTFLVYLFIISVTLCILAVLEINWSGIELEEWWRNEQFWLIGGTSAHLAAVLQGLLKVIAGIEISLTLTSKSAGDNVDDEFFRSLSIQMDISHDTTLHNHL
ncbi:CELLULOSE SYNTHASE-LIKE PROTEIN [Salix koriyanagi]|uniref:CELLULOSE SYNTHASE-LIKE PROTEIN n=1 Tax=Salix koriyanagi TaxID=2511006 RepID=A0A9Q0PXE3_9ROSI|nr:CELLULOSE SYNTHASE-LIKE PROTEIN [Salix koriyanagi]